MKPTQCSVSRCSRCSYYTPEGRRGGSCSQLGVDVKGSWQACSLAAPVFLEPLPVLATLELLPQPVEIRLPEPVVREAVPLVPHASRTFLTA